LNNEPREQKIDWKINYQRKAATQATRKCLQSAGSDTILAPGYKIVQKKVVYIFLLEYIHYIHSFVAKLSSVTYTSPKTYCLCILVVNEQLALQAVHGN